MAEPGDQTEEAMNQRTVTCCRWRAAPSTSTTACGAFMWSPALEDARPDGAYPALCHEFEPLPPSTARTASCWKADGLGRRRQQTHPDGDPEIDAYLDDDDDDFGGEYLSIDDLDG